MMPTRRGRLVCWVKVENLRGSFLVIQQGKVSLLQIGDEAAVLVSDGEDEIHLIDVGLNGEIAIVLRIAALATRGLGNGTERPGNRGWSAW